MMGKEIRLCRSCGIKFDYQIGGELIESRHGEYEYYCEACYHDVAWTCPICNEYVHDDFQGDIGTLFILRSDGEVKQDDGVYEVIKHPYYYDSFLGGGSLIPSAIRRLGDIPDDIAECMPGLYPVEHICPACSETLKRRVLLKRKY